MMRIRKKNDKNQEKTGLEPALTPTVIAVILI